jgi:ribosome-binding protein aMBF1 (putative translation factor)
MSLTDPKAINDLLGFTSDEEREEFAAERLQLDILHVVSVQMRRSGLTRTDLAGHLGVSKSYISQLFAGDTPLNLRTLAKIERVLGGRFHVSMMTPGQRYDSDIENPENVIQYLQ